MVEPPPSSFLRLERLIQGCVPVALTLALVLFGAVPLGIAHYDTVAPFWSLIAVYYWSIYRPALLPAWAVFLLGLLQDLLGGGPVGLIALVLVLVQGVCLSQRRVFVTKSFLVGWWGFAIVASFAAVALWLVASLFYLNLFQLGPLLMQLIFTIALYPPLTWLFNRAEQRLLPAL